MKKEFYSKLLKGSIVSLLSGLVLLMIFAGIYSITGSSDGALIATNIIIRLVAAILCAYIFNNGEKGILKGLLAGLVSFLCMEILFAIFGGLKFDLKLLAELIFSLIFGVIAGIIFANLKNNRLSA